MQIGIVGLPYSGKSALFQTITRTHLAPASLTKSKAHYAVINVPDGRLDVLTELFRPKKTVTATIEVVDVAGLKKGETGSTQFTSNFLSNVKTNDALVQVVRLFRNDTVPHPDGSIDMMRDLSTFETEFILSDLGIIESRIERIRKQIQKSGGENLKKELPLLERCHALLQSEAPLREANLSAAEIKTLVGYQLLTIKPMLIALNLDESQRAEMNSFVETVRATKAGKYTRTIAFFGQIEMEMSELSDEDADAFMRDYGITESALAGIIRASYNLLGLQSFFTVGEDECRAWTITKGITAQEAAGVIHSDFYDKFIRAEVVSYDDLVANDGSLAKVKEKGLWRLEGKDYVVLEGDVLSIRHS